MSRNRSPSGRVNTCCNNLDLGDSDWVEDVNLLMTNTGTVAQSRPLSIQASARNSVVSNNLAVTLVLHQYHSVNHRWPRKVHLVVTICAAPGVGGETFAVAGSNEIAKLLVSGSMCRWDETTPVWG